MLKNDIDEIVGKYCDGTWTNLDNARFVESAKPQRLAEDLVVYIESLLTPHALDGAYWCPKCGDFLGEGGWCPQHGLPASPRK